MPKLVDAKDIVFVAIVTKSGTEIHTNNFAIKPTGSRTRLVIDLDALGEGFVLERGVPDGPRELIESIQANGGVVEDRHRRISIIERHLAVPADAKTIVEGSHRPVVGIKKLLSGG